MKTCFSVVCKLLLLFISVSAALETSERALLFDRTKEWYANQYVSGDPLLALRTQKQDGSWDNIRYNKKGEAPMDHLYNLHAMAMLYQHEQNAGLKDSLKNGIVRGLEFWFSRDKDFVSSNWWTNDIGVLLEINPVAFFLWDELPNEMQKRIISRNPEKSSMGATNKSWIAENVVIRGILENRDNLIKQGIEDIAQVMEYTKLEGHQQDHSFFMHGNILYNGGYGKVALANAAKWAVIMRETPFAFSREALDNMAALALYGTRLMMWKDMVDPAVIGREISRKAGNKNGTGWFPILKDLMKVDTVNFYRYAEWAYSIETKTERFLSGCHYFQTGEMMTCRTNDYFTSLKMSSWRNFGSEFLNRENRKGLWLAMGVLSLYRNSNDYKNIEPLWDWSLLPGVTSYNESEQKEKRMTNQNNYAGGLTQGDFAVAAMIADRPHLYGYKSWFFMGNKVVALGSSFESDHESPISTSVDQRLVHSKVLTATGNIQENTTVDLDRIWCDEVGYVSLDSSKFKALKQRKTGNWRDIGTLNQEESDDVLTIWFDHGKKPQTASYAYLAEIGVDPTSFFNKSHGITYLKLPDFHAVLDKERAILAGAVFSKGEYKFENYSLSFSEPCLFTLHKTESQYVLTITDPTKKKESLEVSVDAPDEKSPEFGKMQKVAFEQPGAIVNVYFDFK